MVESFVSAYDEFAASVTGFDNLLTSYNCRIAGEPGTIGRIAGLNYAGTSIAKLKSLNLPKGLICCDDTESAYLSIKDALVVCKDALGKRTELGNYWHEGFLDLDGAALLSELMTAKSKNALMRGMAENNVYKKVKAYDIDGKRKENLEQDFKLLVDYKNSIQNAQNYITSIRGYLGDLYNPATILGFDMIQVELLNEKAHAAFAGFAAFDPTGFVRKLVGNNDALKDGAGQLKDGTDKLSDGVDTLLTGANDLSNGMVRFDKEGIDKLTSSFEDEGEKVVDRLNATMDAAKSYHSFSGLADGKEGNVKFIMRTEAIK